jgi:hypothetical protein
VRGLASMTDAKKSSIQRILGGGGKREWRPAVHGLALDRAFHRSKDVTKRREIREVFHGTARQLLGELEPGSEIFGMTKGQINSVELISEIQNQIGPCHCALSTWTSSYDSMDQLANLLDGGKLLSCRWLIDPSFKSRHLNGMATLVHRFGMDAIRVIRLHAKFTLLWNEDWKIVYRTSANLNANARMENFEISDDPALFAYMLAFFDEIFSIQTVGLFMESSEEYERIFREFRRTKETEKRLARRKRGSSVAPGLPDF